MQDEALGRPRKSARVTRRHWHDVTQAGWVPGGESRQLTVALNRRPPLSLQVVGPDAASNLKGRRAGLPVLKPEITVD